MKKCCSFSYLSFPRRRESRGVNSGKDSRIGRIRATKTGVTLLEMIVVMAIIIIITAASIPSFLKFINTSRLRGSARDITTALRTARRLAITTRIHRRVTVYLVNSATESAVSFYETPDSIELQRAAANIYFTDGTPQLTQSSISHSVREAPRLFKIQSKSLTPITDILISR